MRIFLTGASGFVGSFFLRNLLSTGRHEVTVLLRTPKTAWRIQELIPDVQVIQGNISHLNDVETQVKDFQPQAFVHLAWNGVLGTDRNALMQWRNVSPTLELVEMASRIGTEHFIALGSHAEYGLCQNKINETTQTRPTTLYGTSKLASCILSERLCQAFNIRFAWIRLFSSYGPMDNPAWMIPYVTRLLLEGGKPSLTKAEQVWDYIYVEDVASAILAVLETSNATGLFNLGSGKAVALRLIIEKIRERINSNLPLGFGDLPYRSDQVMHLEADITRLTNVTGWLPNVTLDTGLRKTIDWYAQA